jgi:CheY-like chemotaxis protein
MMSVSAHEAPPPCRVLVVDDNLNACDSTAMLLQCRGYDARTAFSGFQAIRKVASFAPDLVLLDIEMPGMDGLEVARVIRGISGIKEPVIAAVSGFDSLFHKRQCATAGFDYYLLKPVDPIAFDQLLWFVRHERAAIREKFLDLKREKGSVCFELSRTQLEFGGLVLDVAATSKEPSIQERCFEKVQRMEERMSVFLANEKGFSSEQINTLKILLAGLQVRLLTMRKPM